MIKSLEYAGRQNVANRVFKHYRGGVYRLLCDNVLFRQSDDVSAVFLFEALHSDDGRRLLVFANSKVIFLEEAATNHHESSFYTLYVSLLYGTIWARRSSEFRGKVIVDGREVRRFAMIENYIPEAP